MFEVNCPYCKSTSVSDVCDKIGDSDGVWECANGHLFKLELISYIPPTPEDLKRYNEYLEKKTIGRVRLKHEVVVEYDNPYGGNDIESGSAWLCPDNIQTILRNQVPNVNIIVRKRED